MSRQKEKGFSLSVYEGNKRCRLRRLGKLPPIKLYTLKEFKEMEL